MTTLKAEPLTAAAFAPFGDVLVPPAAPARTYFNGALASLRPDAGPSLSLSYIGEAKSLPLTMTQMERHEFSSQSFVPLTTAPYLIVVAPHAPSGGPDISGARAFIADGGIGVTYGANVWHHPMTVLAAPAQFAIYMWTDGSAGDEEFVTVPETLIVAP